MKQKVSSLFEDVRPDVNSRDYIAKQIYFYDKCLACELSWLFGSKIKL
jgi:hypothetical protein